MKDTVQYCDNVNLYPRLYPPFALDTLPILPSIRPNQGRHHALEIEPDASRREGSHRSVRTQGR